MDEALRLEHPFVSGNSLKLRHWEALASLAEDPGDCNLRRLRTLAEWKMLARSAEVRIFRRSMNPSKRLGRKPCTGLMSLLTRRYDIADSGFPWLCLKGPPIVGRLWSPPFSIRMRFRRLSQSLSCWQQPRREGRLWSRELSSWVRKVGRPKLLPFISIYAKTLKEVAQGSMAGPFTHKELVQQFGEFYNVVLSFGLHQGHDEEGNPKYRRIDDHTAGHTNLAATRTQKIVHDSSTV